eukprot:TRINITY_DN82338_c0_g1_i1.p1 TRINITY_DN82338_c0_g1~~TRINITY_DN82338_c0_g1_i1.p1  ORF type:complete len:246 (-),score=69.97 TRINITY_DN82338_c0_g1_i1:119-856(-)
MFAQDIGYGEDDNEMSADERGRSPRGAGSAAKHLADRAETKLAAGGDIFGSRRGGRGPWKKSPFGGEAFGIAAHLGGAQQQQRRPRLTDEVVEEGDDGRPREDVVELRDYGSKAPPQQRRHGERHSHHAGSELDRQVREHALRQAEEKELSLLTGRRKAPGGQAAARADSRCDEDPMAGLLSVPKTKTSSKTKSSSSSSSSSSDKKAKKKEKKKLKKLKKAEKKAAKKAKKGEKEKSKKAKKKVK